MDAIPGKTAHTRSFCVPETHLTAPDVIGIITGPWRGQVLYTGVELGVFDELTGDAALGATDLAPKLKVDSALLYRLLRALADIGLLRESSDFRFTITEAGSLLRADHPQSLRAMALLEGSPAHNAVWQHLPEMIRSGVQDGFRREFGIPIFEYTRQNPAYASIFSEAMSSYSGLEAHAICQALQGEDFAGATLCDIGGGYGYLLTELLRTHKAAKGIVFDLPEVAEKLESHLPARAGLSDRCQHIGGDMFESVPGADAYFMKHILHDWNDEECVRILKSARRAAKPSSRVFLCERVVPGLAESHFSKLADIHMLCACTGRQRTVAEFGALFEASGWRPTGARTLEGNPIGLVEAAAA
jgi:hypothetical protein